MVFRNLCVLVLWMKAALALEGLTRLLLEVSLQSVIWIYGNFENTFRNKSDFAKKIEEESLVMFRLKIFLYIFSKLILCLKGNTSIASCF